MRKRLLKHSDNYVYKFVSKTLPQIVPLSRCGHCEAASNSGGSSGGDGDEESPFDEKGYPRKRGKSGTGDKVAGKTVTKTLDAKTLDPDKTSIDLQLDYLDEFDESDEPDEFDRPAETQVQPFRLMDLTPELRARIIKLAFSTPNAIICVTDDILRPTPEFDAFTAPLTHTCTLHSACFPCQLHYELSTMGASGLSQTCKQLHAETRLVPYNITTFSVHNLYYLYAFLRVVGPSARAALKSLRFDWKLPEQEARALGLVTDVEATWGLLNECTTLVSLEVDLHVTNLLSWHDNGDERAQRLRWLGELPKIELLLIPRGLNKVVFAWEAVEGFQGMEEWVKVVVGVWSQPWGREMKFGGIEAEVEDVRDGRWKSICWGDGLERRVEKLDE